MLTNAFRIGVAPLCATLRSPAAAQSFRVKVRAKDDIYRAGQTGMGLGLGLVPPSVTLPTGTQGVIASKVAADQSRARGEGCITIDDSENEGTHYNDPDGVGAYPRTSSSTGTASISGIRAPYAGYIVGVFTPAGGPGGSALRRFTSRQATKRPSSVWHPTWTRHSSSAMA